MRRFGLVVLLGLVVACSGDEGPEEPVNGSGAPGPVEAVEFLIDFFAIPNFDAAAPLAFPGHAALASLGEGASFAEVADALREGDLAVASNFWSGFAQGAGSFLTSEVDIEAGPFVTQDRIEFAIAVVTSDTVGERPIITRDSDGYRVDLFASFGAGLASPMIPAVERLLTSQTDDSMLILEELNEVVPSLLLATRQEWVPASAAQDIFRLIELITRQR